VHGANRLGGNGVANSTVFGAVAGDTMAAWVRAQGLREPERAAIQAAIAACERPFRKGKLCDLEALREQLYETMWQKVGIVRDAASLESALADLRGIETALAAGALPDMQRAFNLTWHDWLNLVSLTQVSQVIATAALARRDSRGAHYRADFPDAGSLAQSAYSSYRHGAVAMKQVAFTRVRPGQSLIKNAA
jgi:fumarate reductase flavoprotein subunit